MRYSRVAFKYKGVGRGFKGRVEKNRDQWNCKEYRQKVSDRKGGPAEGFPSDLLIVNNKNE